MDLPGLSIWFHSHISPEADNPKMCASRRETHSQAENWRMKVLDLHAALLLAEFKE
jgi:hypothetical protein